ncbi:MAG: hypothetical protein K2K26_02250, partial [Muribaculaceae bacterium]|nr:hypothetical protein [Muribaculaceae bacterium]
MKDKWLKDLRDTLSDYEMDAPEGLWESIQEDMSVGTEPFSSALLKQSHNRKTWHRNLIAAASIAAALTMGTVIGLWFGKDKRLDSDEIKIAVENRDRLQNSNIPQNKDNSFSVCEETVVQKATVVRNNNIVILCQTVSTSSVDTVMQSKPETIISEDIIDERPLDIEETSGNKNVDECEIHNDDKQQQKSANLFGPRKRTQSNPTTHYADLRLNIKRNKTQESKYYVGLITSGMSSVGTDMKRKIDNPNYVEPDYVDPGSNNPGQNTDPGNTDPDNNFSVGVGVGEGKEPNDKIPDDNPPGSNDN